MWFNSLDFLVFLIVVFPTFYLLGRIPSRYGLPRILFMLLASYFFYMYWNPAYIILVLFSTVWDYSCGLLFLRWPRQYHRHIIAISVTCSLLLLSFFKYGRFAHHSLSVALASIGLGFPAWPASWDFVLPVGISFYTFQTMSYTIDIYRGKAEVERNFFKFAAYVTFFPQLVAGPIEKARALLAQFKDLRYSRPFDLMEAAQRITYGLFKKMAVADSLAVIVDPVLTAPSQYSGATILMAAVFFSFQIYCDFSGYTDIAIGVARLFGIRLSLNFFFPYFTTNVQRFWRTWHISLSSWLREYLYISLGGNRRGRLRTYANLMTTMLLGGLWHGASWNFVIWGFLHGLYLAIHRLISRDHDHELKPVARPWWLRAPWLASAGAFNFALVTLTWIPFRCASLHASTTSVSRIFTWAAAPANPGVLDYRLVATGWMMIGLLLVFDLFYRIDADLAKRPGWLSCVHVVLPPIFVLLTIIFAAATAQQFIYFQF